MTLRKSEHTDHLLKSMHTCRHGCFPRILQPHPVVPSSQQDPAISANSLEQLRTVSAGLKKKKKQGGHQKDPSQIQGHLVPSSGTQIILRSDMRRVQPLSADSQFHTAPFISCIPASAPAGAPSRSSPGPHHWLPHFSPSSLKLPQAATFPGPPNPDPNHRA